MDIVGRKLNIVGHYWDLKGLIIETENGCSMTDFIFNNNIKIYK